MTAIVETTNIYNASSNGVTLSSGESLFIVAGVTVAGGTSGGAYNGAASSGGNIFAQILGTLWGNQDGVAFDAGGNNLTIGANGSVIGNYIGIDLEAAGNVVNNAGDIVGSYSSANGAAAINFGNGGGDTLANTGTITGGNGIYADNGGNSITNSGTIDGVAGNAINLETSADTTDAIVNTGTIESSPDSAIADFGTGSLFVTDSGTLAGGIYTSGLNSASILIESGGHVIGSINDQVDDNAGIQISGGTNTITNDGEISAPNGNLAIALDTPSEITDTINNSGTIEATISAIYDSGAGALTLTNSGTIVGTIAATSSSGGNNITVDAGGHVTASFDSAIVLSGSGNILSNDGEISALSGQTAIDLSASSGGSTVENNGTVMGTIGINLKGGGNSVDNTGIIDGLGNSAIIADTSSASGDTIDNSGTIKTNASTGAIDETGADSLSVRNSGTISGGIQALSSSGENSILVESGGKLAAGDASFAIELAGSTNAITNDGEISNQGGYAINYYSLGTGSNSVDNNGVIVGTSGIAFTAGSNDVDNTGTVKGTGSGGYGILLETSSGQTDTITNAGKIQVSDTVASGDAIFDGGDGALNLTNSGKIDGSIQLDGAGNELNNTGSIVGSLSFGGALINNGTIDGSVATAGSFTNTDIIVGNVTFSAESTLANDGTIAGSVTFQGSSDTITNDGLIHGAVSLGSTDTFTNDGTIRGTLTTGAHDTLNLSTGSVTGNIVGSGGYDTFEFSGEFGHYKISGFTTAGNHDIINFASDDFTSYSELQSHMVQEGNDVVITLDASDDIIILNMKLANLLSHDFTFS